MPFIPSIWKAKDHLILLYWSLWNKQTLICQLKCKEWLVGNQDCNSWDLVGMQWVLSQSFPNRGRTKVYPHLASLLSISLWNCRSLGPRVGSQRCSLPRYAWRRQNSNFGFQSSVFSLAGLAGLAGVGTRLDNFFWIAMAFMIFRWPLS